MTKLAWHWVNKVWFFKCHDSTGRTRRLPWIYLSFLDPTNGHGLGPPIGYACVYESWLLKDIQLWFPIPQSITAYCKIRDHCCGVDDPGFQDCCINGVRVFENLFQFQVKQKGYIYAKMKLKMNILTGHPSKTQNEPGRIWGTPTDFWFLWARKCGREDDVMFTVLWYTCTNHFFIAQFGIPIPLPTMRTSL